MLEDPKITVVIPCYNSEPFITDTIQSVLRQTFKDFEIVIIDDGSTDRTKDMINSFSDTRIRYYYQENKGISQTRNVALEYSRGEYIAFLDHDDEWLPDKLEKQLALIERDRGLGIVFSDAYIKSEDGTIKTFFSERKPLRGKVFYEYLFSDNFVPLLTVLTPRAVISKYLPFESRYQISEEFDIFLKIARDYRFNYINEPLAIYHRHKTNTIKKNPERAVEEKFIILKYWLDNDPSIKNFYSHSIKNRLAWLYYKQGECYLDNGKYNMALGSAFKSIYCKKLNRGCIKLFIKFIFRILGSDYTCILKIKNILLECLK